MLTWRLSGTLPALECLTLRGNGTRVLGSNRPSAGPDIANMVAPALTSIRMANFDRKGMRASGFLLRPTLEGLQTLRWVALTGCNLRRTAVPLAALPRLEHLDLSGSYFGDEQASSLAMHLRLMLHGCQALWSLVLPRVPQKDPLIDCFFMRSCVAVLPALCQLQLSAGSDRHLTLYGGFDDHFAEALAQVVEAADFGSRPIVLRSSDKTVMEWGFVYHACWLYI